MRTHLSHNIVFMICGPSGVGKSTLLRRLPDEDQRVIRCLSWTTRPPRAGETNGLDYHFTDQSSFQALRSQGDIIGGGVEQFGFLYGLRASDIETALRAGSSVLVESNLEGVVQLKTRFPDLAAIFIAPLSFQVLSERLLRRERESPEEIAVRLAQARDLLEKVFLYPVDYYIINDDIECCLRILRAIISSEFYRLRHHSKEYY